MSTHYVDGGALSTAQTEQTISEGSSAPPATIPATAIERAQNLAAQSATYADLRSRSPLLETNPEELYRRVGERLTGTEHAVYGVVRQARRLNFPAACVSHRELADLVGRHERSCRRAVARLLRLELLRAVPQFRVGFGPALGLGYDRSQTRNVYVLARRAKEPRVLPALGGARPPRSSSRTTDNSPDKIASLSEGRTEFLKNSVSPSAFLRSTARPTTQKPPAGGEKVPPIGGERSAANAACEAAPVGAAQPAPEHGKSKSRTAPLTATLGELAQLRAELRRTLPRMSAGGLLDDAGAAP